MTIALCGGRHLKESSRFTFAAGPQSFLLRPGRLFSELRIGKLAQAEEANKRP